MKRFLKITTIAIIALAVVLFIRNRGGDSEADSEAVATERVFTQSDYERMGAPDTLVIPSEFTTIGKSAFFDCAALTSITLPASLTTISDYAFASCVGLMSLEIPSSVTSIGVGAFRDCMMLPAITIPSSVTKIGSAVFERCDKLRAVYVSASSPVYQTLKDEYEDLIVAKELD